MERGMGNNIWGEFWKLKKRMMTRSETKNMSLHLFFLQWGNYFTYNFFNAFFVNKIELPIGYKYKLLFFDLSCRLQGSGGNICIFRKNKIYMHQSMVKPRNYSRNRQNNNVGIRDPTL